MSLSKMIKKIKKENNDIKILFIGLDNAGKTTILHKLFKSGNTDISPTFGYEIHSFQYLHHLQNKTAVPVNLTILDVGGQESFRKYWCNFYEKIDGIVFVFDGCDTREFESLFGDIVEINSGSNVPFLVLANKFDLWNSKEYCDIKVEGENVKMFECSGKTGYNLNIAFEWLLVKILESRI